jgi:hypothetical protein
LATGIVANPGGGQSGAVLIAAVQNVVATVATTGDSVALQPSAGQMFVMVANQGANSLNVFPFTGDSINALSANAAFAIPAGKTAIFSIAGYGEPWFSVLTA